MSRNARTQLLLCLLLSWLPLARAQDYFAAPATNAAARVLMVQATNLLDAYLPVDDRVEAAFNRGLLAFTRATNAVSAWRSLITTNDTIGIKVFSAPGALSGTRPAVVAAIVRGLRDAGVPGGHIVIWDKHDEDLRDAGFYQLAESLGVRVAGAVEAGFDTNVFYLPDSPVIGSLVWGDTEFGEPRSARSNLGKKSYLSRLVSQQLTKIISVAPLISENDAGLCGHFFSLALGSVDNTRRFEGDPGRLAVALPEIDAMPAIGDRVVLHVTDALLGQYQGGPASYLQFSTVLNELWFSKDPVALDSLALREMIHERTARLSPPLQLNSQLYTNAVLLQLGVSDPARIQIEKIK